MTEPHRRRRGTLVAASLAVVLGASATGCEAETIYYPVYVPPYGPPPVSCRGGVDAGAVDTGGLLDLDPGYGVGATVEYTGDGTWRVAVACDSLISGFVCNWTVLVASVDGTIDDFETEELEDEDFIERRPAGSAGDGVFLDALTADGLDAFTVFATPEAGLSVNIDIDGYCGGPYLFWLDGGAVRSSTTNTTELFPQG